MTRPNVTDISFVLDRSGSMQKVRQQTVESFNQFIADQQNVPGAARLTLVQFDDQYELVHDTVPLAQVPPLTARTFVPRGSTALLDAIGRTINATGARLAALPEHGRPGQVLFVVLTDGLENASQEFTARQVFAMISHQRDTYSWQFVFLGADQDAIATAVAMGIPASAAIAFAATPAGTADMMGKLSRATSRHRMTRRPMSDSFFLDEDRDPKQAPSSSPGSKSKR